jgi:hypothetical protein
MEPIVKIVNLDRSKCVLFDYYFNESCNEFMSKNNVKRIEVTESIEHLWLETIGKIQKIINSIDNGSIFLNELDVILEKFFHKEFINMQSEMNYLLEYFKISNLDTRKKQLKLWDK